MSFKIVADHIIDHVLAFTVLSLELDRAYKLRHLIDVVLMKRYTSNSGWITLHNERPVFEIRQNKRCDLKVVTKQIKLRIAFVGPINAVETCQTDDMFANLHRCVALCIFHIDNVLD